MEGNHLLIPLPLAELLYVTLGPLCEVLRKEEHPWAGLVRAVVQAYREGRDSALHKTYGDGVVQDIDVVTYLVSEELAKWAEDLAGMATDFELWRQELDDE